MSQDWMQQGPPPPPPPPPAYNPYGYSGAPPPTPGGSGLAFPWEDRARLGFVQALIETIKLLVTQPVEAFSRLQPNGDLTSPLLFGLIISWPATIVALGWQLIFGGMMGLQNDQAMPFGGPMYLGLMAVFYPILYLIGTFIGAGILHLCLMVVKGLDQSSFAFEGTLKVICYGGIGNLAQVVPVIGGLVGAVVNLILFVLGARTVHRTTTQKAIFAILLPLAVCCVCAILAVFVGGFGAAMMGPR